MSSLVLIALAHSAHAATFTVDDLGDTYDADCVTADAGCSLRSALELANRNGEADTIYLPGGIIQLTHGALTIREDVDIYGKYTPNTHTCNSHVTGTGEHRVLEVTGDLDVRIECMRVSNGESYGGGGGIRARGDGLRLDLFDVEVHDNTTLGTNHGGGVHFDGQRLRIWDSAIHGNIAQGSGGGLYVDGLFRMLRSEVYDNRASTGGGLRITPRDDSRIMRSSVYWNDASNGAGIYVGFGDTLKLINSTLAQNEATDNGGGLYIAGALVTAWSSTIAENIAGNPYGGGGGVAVSDGSANAGFRMGDTILTGNQGRLTLNRYGVVYRPETQCVGDIVSFGHNAFGSEDPYMEPCGYAPATTDIYGGHMPYNLKYWGGPTRTFKIPEDSSFRDAAQPGRCGGVDQRGYERGTDTCDIGAVEWQRGDG